MNKRITLCTKSPANTRVFFLTLASMCLMAFLGAPMAQAQTCQDCTNAYTTCMNNDLLAEQTCSQKATGNLGECTQEAQVEYDACQQDCANSCGTTGSQCYQYCLSSCDYFLGVEQSECQAQYSLDSYQCTSAQANEDSVCAATEQQCFINLGC